MRSGTACTSTQKEFLHPALFLVMCRSAEPLLSRISDLDDRAPNLTHNMYEMWRVILRMNMDAANRHLHHYWIYSLICCTVVHFLGINRLNINKYLRPTSVWEAFQGFWTVSM
jgi:hypothetical protein